MVVGTGKGIGPGMTKTRAECKGMLLRRVHDDFYQVIVQCSPNLSKAPVSVRASMISGSYNFGVGAWCKSTAKARIEAGQWRAACEAQTAFNRAGGQIVRGLVNRREMGDAQRIGEAELCVSVL
uniref:Lysozyme n=1 Tax=Agrobacterium rosae TaxID=1972867 RepID=A0ABU4VY46_9HYPH|nr:glycoside hydrolase family protein [Agrobacterium rosae]MDX8330440.1 glycoside hydrolase family protein [Agrobacterium rosae]